MTTATPAAVSSERVRARARASDRNLSACEGICAASARNKKSFKRSQLSPAFQTERRAARLRALARSARGTRNPQNVEFFRCGFPPKNAWSVAS